MSGSFRTTTSTGSWSAWVRDHMDVDDVEAAHRDPLEHHGRYVLTELARAHQLDDASRWSRRHPDEYGRSRSVDARSQSTRHRQEDITSVILRKGRHRSR